MAKFITVTNKERTVKKKIIQEYKSTINIESIVEVNNRDGECIIWYFWASGQTVCAVVKESYEEVCAMLKSAE